RVDQASSNAWLSRRMTSIGNDHVFGFGPRAVQIVGRNDGTDHIVSTLHDGAWKVADPVDVGEQRILRNEQIVHEVMRFDSGGGEGGRILVEMRDEIRLGEQRR